jgi:hypothetical protein
MDKKKRSNPFLYGVHLKGPKGEVIQLQSVSDAGAMVNTINFGVFNQSKDRLTKLHTLKHVLCMADGRLIPSDVVWIGDITLAGVTVIGIFEIFDSGGAWALLFGNHFPKPSKQSMTLEKMWSRYHSTVGGKKTGCRWDIAAGSLRW